MSSDNSKIRIVFVTKAACIAALYAGLTFISSLFGFSNGLIQLRLSEALTILPAFTTSAIPGLFFGCLISNIICGGTILDIILGSVASLLGAIFTYYLRKNYIFSILSPIICNTLIVPIVLIYGYGINLPFFLVALYIFAGETISAGILGILLYFAIRKNNQLKRIICDD